MTRTMHLTGDAAADELLASDANALLLGILLDQQFPMERAFLGPAIIAERLGRLDVAEIAGMDPRRSRALLPTPRCTASASMASASIGVSRPGGRGSAAQSSTRRRVPS